MTNAPKSAKPIPAWRLIAYALDWIEVQVQTDDSLPASALQRQLVECERFVAAAWHHLSQQKSVEIHGPAGTYPLAVALNIIAIASGKPWGFIATPRTWSKEDWQKVEDAIATLSCLPLRYRTGFRKLGMEYWPTL